MSEFGGKLKVSSAERLKRSTLGLQFRQKSVGFCELYDLGRFRMFKLLHF